MSDREQKVETKSWYKTPLGILVLLAFWPFSLTYWISKRSWNLWQRIGVIALLWIILFGVGSLGEKGGWKALQSGWKAGKQTGIAIPTSAPSPTTMPTLIPTTEATPKPTEKPKTTEERLREIAVEKFKDDKDLKTEYDKQSGLFSVAYGGQSMFLSEAKIVEGMFSSLVRTGRDVFQVERVNSLKISVENKLTDSYGKESIETVASITMSKDEFEKYNWDNLRFQPIYYQMEQSSDELYIHPALLNKIELSKLKLYYTN